MFTTGTPKTHPMTVDPTLKIYTLLIPIETTHVLLPTAAIAEVLSLAYLVEDKKHSDIAGYTQWQRKSLPVICFNHTDPAKKSSTNSTTRYTIVVVKMPSELGDYLPIGIIASNTPRIIQATSRNLKADLHPQYLYSCALSYVLINQLPAFIPDLQKLHHLGVHR